jgi:hypothetical protein
MSCEHDIPIRQRAHQGPCRHAKTTRGNDSSIRYCSKFCIDCAFVMPPSVAETLPASRGTQLRVPSKDSGRHIVRQSWERVGAIRRHEMTPGTGCFPPVYSEIAPWVSHPSANPMHLSNATYFYTNSKPHPNRRLRGLPAIGEVSADRLRFAGPSHASRPDPVAALYKDDLIRKTVF